MYEKICPNCGMRLSYFLDTGMLGCPSCYDAFAPEINRAILQIQSGDFHVGKAPKLNGVDKELLGTYQSLLKEKELAGMEGRFLEMAKLNREIDELKEVLKSKGLI